MDLVLISGLPGSGKSTLSEYYVREKNFIRLGSDTIRASLYSGLEKDSCKYHTAITRAVFEIMYLKTELFLNEKKSVVLDAIHRKEEGRQRVIEISKKFGIQPLFIEIICSLETIKSRIANRKVDPYDSDVNSEILEQYLSRINNPVNIDLDFKKKLESEGFQVQFYNSEIGEFI